MNVSLESSADLSGQVLGNQFRLERLLGRGGMGEVYLAEQLEVGRHVVIKLLRATRFGGADAEERFRREARALAQLNHPNVVQLYSAGRDDDGRAYLAMEYVDGHTLGSLIAETGAMPEARVIGILDQLCDALIEAHQRGIIHRDLKPENVMLVERRDRPLVKVLDFGIAKLMRDPAVRLTRDGELLGTPLYMAPELLRNQPPDERTDIYGVGLVGYELLTGQGPFPAESTVDLLVRIATTQPVPPHACVPEGQISLGLSELIMRCLAKDPEERWSSVAALREALAECHAARQPAPRARESDAALQLQVWNSADPTPTHTGIRRSQRSSALARWAVTLLALVLLAAVGLWFVGMREEVVEPHAEPTPPGATDDSPASGPLEVREWVQGIPFPVGTDYTTFDPQRIEATIAARPERVLTFYRKHFSTGWGSSRSIADGVTFDDPRAAIEQLRVTPTRKGSHLVITRRSPASK